MKGKEPGEIEIASIHYDEGSRIDGKNIKDVQIVALSAGDINEGRNRAVHIHQGVKLDGRFGFAEFGPGKERQAEVYGGRIKSVNSGVDFKTDVGIGVKRSGNIDQ